MYGVGIGEGHADVEVAHGCGRLAAQQREVHAGRRGDDEPVVGLADVAFYTEQVTIEAQRPLGVAAGESDVVDAGDASIIAQRAHHVMAVAWHVR